MKTSFESLSPIPQLLLIDGNRAIKDFEKKTGYNNYDQRNYGDLSTLYANNINL